MQKTVVVLGVGGVRCRTIGGQDSSINSEMEA